VSLVAGLRREQLHCGVHRQWLDGARGEPVDRAAGDQNVAVAGGWQEAGACGGIGDVVEHQEPGAGVLGEQVEGFRAGVGDLRGLAGREEDVQEGAELGVDGRRILGADPPDQRVRAQMLLSVGTGEAGLANAAHPGQHLD
jgi:hypothetical protein